MNKNLAADGISKCVKNAERLIKAAQILFKKNSDVGTALLTTAIEEYAKITLIVGFYNGKYSEKQFQKLFPSHNAKRYIANLISVIGTYVADNPKDAFNFKKLISKLDFDAVRDDVLYVNYISISGKFTIPKLDFNNFAMILRLALRLKRIFSAIKTKKAGNYGVRSCFFAFQIIVML